MKTRKSPRTGELVIRCLKHGIPSKRVLSCSYFTMEDAYRDIEKYKRYFMKFLSQKNALKGFETRVYTDDSGKDFILKVTRHEPTVSVYHYNYAPLREKVGHIGTLGTLIRFLPFFEPGLDIVWVSDIDIPNYYLNPALLKTSADFIYRTYPAYKTSLYGKPYTIVANAMISFKQFPKELFHTYLHNLIHPTDSLATYIDKQNKDNELAKKPYSRIPYGIDEYFMNQILYDYIVKNIFQCYIIKDYWYVFIYLRYNKLITDEEDALVYSYSIFPNPQTFEKLKKLYLEKISLVESKYPGCTTTLTDSFVKTFSKKGEELNHFSV